jgi:hypothetical protein
MSKDDDGTLPRSAKNGPRQARSDIHGDISIQLGFMRPVAVDSNMQEESIYIFFDENERRAFECTPNLLN